MSWDLKSLPEAMKDRSFNPRGRIALVTHNCEGWQGAENDWHSRSYFDVKAGASCMITDITIKKRTFGQAAATATVFYEGRTLKISADRLFLINPENKFEKKAFAITGKLSKQREFYKALIKLKGGVWKNQVSNNTDVLIVGNNNRGSETTKYKKAVRLGKQIIEEADLNQLLRK